MKINCLKSDLMDVLNFITNAVAVKPQNQVLGGIYLSAANNQLEIHATDYSIGMMAKIPVDSQIDGKVVVLGKKFIDVIRSMPGDTVAISEDSREKLLEIASGKSRFFINTLEADDFPKIISKDAILSFKIKADVLRTLIKKTIFACATEESQPIYTGCLFESDNEKITVVATNKHRLAMAVGSLIETTDNFRFVIPRDALRVVLEMLNDTEENLIKIEYSGKKVAFTINKVFVTVRILEGDYPDYRRVIPPDADSVITAEVPKLRSAIERVSLIAREDFNKKITFNFTSEYGLELKASSAQYGAAEETLNIDKNGQGANLAFNYTYMTDVLRIVDVDKIKISMRGHYDPVDIREIDSDDFVYVMTPLRP